MPSLPIGRTAHVSFPRGPISGATGRQRLGDQALGVHRVIMIRDRLPLQVHSSYSPQQIIPIVVIAPRSVTAQNPPATQPGGSAIFVCRTAAAPRRDHNPASRPTPHCLHRTEEPPYVC